MRRVVVLLLIGAACGKSADHPPAVESAAGSASAIADLLDARMRWDVQIALTEPAADRARFDDRRRGMQPEVTAKIDHDLGLVGKTRSDVEHARAAIQAKCDTDPRFKDVMDKAGFVPPPP